MYTLGVVEESLAGKDVLADLKSYLVSQRVEEIPGDAVPVWHTNEYHVPDSEIRSLLPLLEKQILPTWYIHAFSDTELFVILRGKSFSISRERDESWDGMIAYGEANGVERRYLERIPLRV